MARSTSAAWFVSSFCLVAVAGCGGCSSAAPAVGGTSTTADTPTPTDTHSGPTTPLFDLHEWGLIDVNADTARIVGGPSAGPTNWDAPRRKPVLYFHLADPAAPLNDARVTVTLPSGTFVEHYPAGVLASEGRSLTWNTLDVRGAFCPVTTIPTRMSPGCQTPDNECEAAELRTYQTPDASCVAMGGSDYNHLFYRAGGPAPALPFAVAIQGSQLSITHARGADLVGPIIYVHNDNGAVTVALLAPPALGDSITAAPPTGTDVAAAQDALGAAMQHVGLTGEEIGAFRRAWDNDLFGRGAARDISRRAAAGPHDYLLFTMPASLIDGASRVEVVPAARALRRFMLVRMSV